MEVHQLTGSRIFLPVNPGRQKHWTNPAAPLDIHIAIGWHPPLATWHGPENVQVWPSPSYPLKISWNWKFWEWKKISWNLFIYLPRTISTSPGSSCIITCHRRISATTTIIAKAEKNYQKNVWKWKIEKFVKLMLIYTCLIHSLISSQKNPSPVKPEGHGAHLKFHGKKNSWN